MKSKTTPIYVTLCRDEECTPATSTVIPRMIVRPAPTKEAPVEKEIAEVQDQKQVSIPFTIHPIFRFVAFEENAAFQK